MLIKRAIEKELDQLLKEYPVVTVLGPRQPGKTTLTTLKKMALPPWRFRSQVKSKHWHITRYGLTLLATTSPLCFSTIIAWRLNLCKKGLEVQKRIK